MTRTRQPISEGAFTVEPTAAEESTTVVELRTEPRIFDFTVPVDLMDDETKSVYYRLRRVAMTAPAGEFLVQQGQGDAKQLPDGKTYTEAEVIEILGPDYINGLAITKACCG